MDKAKLRLARALLDDLYGPGRSNDPEVLGGLTIRTSHRGRQPEWVKRAQTHERARRA